MAPLLYDLGLNINYHLLHGLLALAMGCWCLGLFSLKRVLSRFLPQALYALAITFTELARWLCINLQVSPQATLLIEFSGIAAAGGALVYFLIVVAAERPTSALLWRAVFLIPHLMVMAMPIALANQLLPGLGEDYAVFSAIGIALLITHVGVNTLAVDRTRVLLPVYMVAGVTVIGSINHWINGKTRRQVDEALVTSADGLAAALQGDVVTLLADGDAGAGLAARERLANSLRGVRQSRLDLVDAAIALRQVGPPPSWRLVRPSSAGPPDPGTEIEFEALLPGLPDLRAPSVLGPILQNGARCMIVVTPLHTHEGGEVAALLGFGVLEQVYLRARRQNAFTVEWVVLLLTLAVYTCFSIYALTNSKVRRRDALMGATALTTNQLLGGQPSLEATQPLVDHLGRHLSAIVVEFWICGVDDLRQQFQRHACSLPIRPDGEGWCDWSTLPAEWPAELRAGQTLTREVPANALRDVLPPGQRVHILAQPIFHHGALWGVIVLFFTDGGMPQMTEALPALRTLANAFTFALNREERTRALQAAVVAAETSNRAKGEFLATMSHELRTPLNSIIGFAALLQRSTLSTSQQVWLTTLNHSAEQLLTLINDLLDLAKIEAGGLTLNQSPFDLRGCLEQALKALSPQLSGKPLSLDFLFDAPGDYHEVRGDALRLRQAVLNLAGNAIKFTPAGRVLVHVTRAAPGEWCFKVSDTGPGIPPEKQAHLFKRFSQLDSSITRSHGGSGLGLAITQEIVRLMGGTLLLQSAPGEGATFTFTAQLPPVAASPAALPAPPPTEPLTKIGLFQPDAIDLAVTHSLVEQTGFETCAIDPQAPPAALAQQLQACGIVLFPHSYRESVQLAAHRLQQVLVSAGLTGVRFIGLHVAGRSPNPRLFDVSLPSPTIRHELFPLLLTPSPPLPTLPSALPTARPRRPHPRALRVLVAEDNDINRDLMRTVLEQAGVAADFTEDGHQAINALRTRRYDFALIDIHMPHTDGYAVARWARDDWSAPWPRPRLIAVTADARETDRDRCFVAGMDAHLTKPVDIDALHALLGLHFEPSAAGTSPPKQETLIDWPRLNQLFDFIDGRNAPQGFGRIVANYRAQAVEIVETLRTLPADAVAEEHSLLHKLKGSSHSLCFLAAPRLIDEAYQQPRPLSAADREVWCDLLLNTIYRSIAELTTRLE